jgi:peptidoglycan/xylan/chitin deacetylase (PgdA/CDA1 family)
MHLSIVSDRPLQQLPSMSTLRSLRAIPRALANWAGITGRDERPVARILLFHGTPRRDAAALERELRWLKRRFQIVPLRAIVAVAANGGTLGAKVALTFDDGLRSNVEVAYPLLHRLAIPATFFVCPGLVDRAKWLWTHEARRRLSRLSEEARRELAQEWRAAADIEGFVDWMKTLDNVSRRRVEVRLREATPDFSPTAAEREEFDLADWEQLRRLDAGIVTIGSHTLTHPILPGTPAAELEEEVRDSRRQLERGLERPVDTFAYPNGELDPAAEACVRKHYRAAVVASGGWVRPGADAHRLPRRAAPTGVLRLARTIYA